MIMDAMSAAIMGGVVLLEIRTQYKLGRLEQRLNDLNGSADGHGVRHG